MKIKVYQSESDSFIEMNTIGKVILLQDIHNSLTKGKEYYLINQDVDNLIRIVDDTEEDYLYPLRNKFGNVFKLIEAYDDSAYNIFNSNTKNQSSNDSIHDILDSKILSNEINDLSHIYKYSIKNKNILKDSKECVCFYCISKFSYDEIKEWIDDKNEYTAICPKCGVDSVLPNKIDGKYIPSKILEIMKEKYF